MFNRPICARSTFFYEQILLIKIVHQLEDKKSLPPFKDPSVPHGPHQTLVPAQVERWSNIPVGW